MKTISWITDLIKNIPELLNYFVPGYIFISIYNFMLLKKANVQESNFIILKSIAISYILKTLYDKIITQWEIEVLYVEIDPLLNVTILLFISLILGYLLGLIGYSPVANKFLLRFGIHRTVKENIWANVLKKGHYIRVFKKDYSKSYCGQCTFYENDTREPIIVLSRYDCEPIKINGCKITYYNNVVDNSNILVKLQGSFVNNKVIELLQQKDFGKTLSVVCEPATFIHCNSETDNERSKSRKRGK